MDITDELLKHLDKVLPSRARLFIGFSGGLDSSVLLQMTRMTRPDAEITAIHCNHGLSPEADRWQSFCEKQAEANNARFIGERLSFPSGFSEAKGRDARYEVFRKYIEQGDRLLLGHHADDQTETLLFRLFRGTGPKGLAGMEHERAIGNGQIVRPLLGFGKQQLRQIAKEQGISWIEDESNEDDRFDRNYIRNQIMPPILNRWPRAMESVKELTAILREDQSLLSNYAGELIKRVDFKRGPQQSSLDMLLLDQLPEAEKRLVLRQVFQSITGLVLNKTLLDQINQQFLASAEEAEPCVEVAGYEIRRFESRLFLVGELPKVAADFETLWDAKKPLEIGGLGQLELIEGCADTFLVRFRQGGERARPLDRKHSQKLKKLFQEYRVEPWLRSRMPLILLNDEIINIGGSIRCSEHRFLLKPAHG